MQVKGCGGDAQVPVRVGATSFLPSAFSGAPKTSRRIPPFVLVIPFLGTAPKEPIQSTVRDSSARVFATALFIKVEMWKASRYLARGSSYAEYSRALRNISEGGLVTRELRDLRLNEEGRVDDGLALQGAGAPVGKRRVAPCRPEAGGAACAGAGASRQTLQRMLIR